MALLNGQFIAFDGEPITGRVPAQVINETPTVEFTKQQWGAVAHAYKLFTDSVRVSLPGFHVQNRSYADGMRLRLESNNGVDRVFVWLPGGDELYIPDALYLDTCTVEWSYPGSLNPERYDPATVESFVDVPVTSVSRWVGEVFIAVLKKLTKKFVAIAPGKWRHLFPGVEAEPILGAQTPNQLQNRPLVVGMDSFCLGYPVTTTAQQLQKMKDEWGEMLVLKKITMGYFKPGIFSGKMRLWMQAQYGAPLFVQRKQFLYVDLVGSEPVLRYTNADSDAGNTQLTWWPHNTTGIYTSPDGRFWLMRISIPTGRTVLVHAYNISPTNESARGLYEAYRAHKQGKHVQGFASVVTPEEESKIEAYLFAYSKIELDSVQEVGSFEIPTGVSLGSLAYGWKFNRQGDKASIVLAGEMGETGDVHITSATVHITFTYSPPSSGPINGTAIRMSHEYTRNADWLDGWGVYNIFVPSDVSGGELDHFSSRAGWPGVRDIASFPPTPVYGYYGGVDGSAWIETKIGKEAPITEPRDRKSISGPAWFAPDFNFEAITHWYQYAYHVAGTSISWERETATSTNTMTISVGGFSFEGEDSYKSLFEWFKDYGGSAGTSEPRYYNFYASHIGGAYYYDGLEDHAPGYNELNDLINSSEDPVLPPSGLNVSCALQSITVNSRSTIGRFYKKWTLVIPSHDCECAYVGTYQLREPTSGSTRLETSPAVTVTFLVTLIGGNVAEVTPVVMGETYSTYGDTAGTVTSTSDPYIHDPFVKIYMIDKTDVTTEGIPSTSYYTLFNVDHNYPIFAPGMKTVQSYGNRVYGSENIKRPDSVPDNPNFVGWI